ncbi:MAG TPA: ABC transporter substrate-binding protein [Nitrospiraceae bacterium]|jgi:branched-chain amino acid transport system substrate-binding protein|nr:ABC transporter substrate-binding protein [Nitrospiraceae bacterium]
MMKRVVIPIVLFLATVGSADAAKFIRIGLTLGLTGTYREMSDMQMKGFRLWQKDVNSRDGILGRKLQLLILDDKSDPQTAKSLYEQFITRDKVDLLFAPYSSEITAAILPVTEKYGYPLLASGASADRLWQVGYKYLFGFYTRASNTTVGFLEMAMEKGFHNLGIVYEEDPFSEDVAYGAKKWAGRFGLNVRLFEGVKKGRGNIDELARKAKASNAQIVIACGYSAIAVDMRLALKKIGWYPNAYFATSATALPSYYNRLKADADYSFSQSQWEHHSRLDLFGGEKFHEEFVKAYREEPSFQAAQAYAAGQILEQAIRKGGSLDRQQIRDVLSTMDASSIIGRYGVDATGMQIKHFNLIIQWQKGKKEIVWPEELRTAPPIFKETNEENNQ